MQSGSFVGLGEKSDTSTGVYPEAASSTVFAVNPLSIIRGA